jgi:isatin hydrolase
MSRPAPKRNSRRSFSGCDVTPPRRIVDLSLPLAEDLPCSWPDDIPFQHTLFNWFVDRPDPVAPLVSRGAFHTRWLMLAEHTGTHFDAPAHWVQPPGSGLRGAGPAGDITTDGVPLEQLTGPAVVIDLTALPEVGPGRSPPIAAVHVEAFEAEHGPIGEDDVVLFRTGWDRHYVAGAAGRRYITGCVAGREPGWPAPTAEAVSLLVQRGVRCLGTDAPSVGAVEDGYPAHVAGLAHGLIYVEGLCRLEQLPVRGSEFLFLPISLRGGTGAPGRAIGLLD